MSSKTQTNFFNALLSACPRQILIIYHNGMLLKAIYEHLDEQHNSKMIQYNNNVIQYNNKIIIRLQPFLTLSGKILQILSRHRLAVSIELAKIAKCWYNHGAFTGITWNKITVK